MEKTLNHRIWVNGQIQTDISVLDRGFTYGDGVFETLRLNQSHPVFWDQHKRRLQKGLQRLQIAPIPDLEANIQRFLASVSVSDPAILRIAVTRGAGSRGYLGNLDHQPTVVFSLHDVPDRTHWRSGIRLFSCQTPLGLNPALAGIKHLNRLEQVMARAEWRSEDYQEGLMSNSTGAPICGIMSNLFIVQQGQLYTPNLDQCGIAGIARAYIIEQARLKGEHCTITTLSKESLLQADEVFLCNSVFGVWPVCAYQNQHWPMGPIAQHYQSILDEAIYEAV